MGIFSCCVPKAKDHTYEFKPADKRSCSDVLFLLLFIGSWVVMISLLGAVVDQGDPNKLIRGVDYKGDVCGDSSAEDANKLAAWPNYNFYQLKICVDDCAKTLTDDRMVISHKSTKYLYYCIPTDLANGTGISLHGFDSVSAEAERAMGDLWTSWPVILASGFIAIVFAYLYLKMTRCMARCLVWFVILFFLIAGAATSIMFLKYGYDAQDSADEKSADGMLAMGYICSVLTLISLCVICFLRNDINIAVEVVKEAASAISDMKCLAFFWILPFCLGLAFCVYWVIMCLFIFSVSDKEEKDLDSDFNSEGVAFWNGMTNYTDYVWNEEYQNTFAIHFFHFLWVIQFLTYFCYLTIAGAAAQWYFAMKGDDGQPVVGDGESMLPANPVTKSCWRAFRFGMGTVAFGSFIIAVVQFLRAVVKYIESKVKTKHPSTLQKVMWKCIHCCLWCTECCLDKVSRNAFIWHAVYGDSFLVSACSSFKLVINNLTKIAALTYVGAFLLFIGKVVVALGTTAVCGFIIEAAYGDDISSLVVPCVVIFLLAYFVASIFMVSFDTTIDCIFLCFLIDVDTADANRPIAASPALQELVNKHSASSKAKADRYHELKNMKLENTENYAGVAEGTNASAPASAPAPTNASDDV